MANDFSHFTGRDEEPSTERTEDMLSRRAEEAAEERRYYAEDGEGDDLTSAARLLERQTDDANARQDYRDADADEVRRAYEETANPEKPKTLAYSVTSLVFSVLAIICCCSGFLSCLFGILAIVFAIVSRHHLGYFDSMAIVGLIIGIIGAILGLFVGLVTVLGLFSDFEIFSESVGDIQTDF